MELYLPPPRPQYNPVNGRFLKGATPFNKGLPMREWMDGRKIKKVLKGLQRRGRNNIGGWNRKKVIGIKDGKIVAVFDSSSDAGRKLKLIARNIRHCCEGKRKKCGGIYWFHENDFQRWSKYLNQD